MSRNDKLKNTDKSKTDQSKEIDGSLWDKVRARAKDALANEIAPTLSAMGRQGASEIGVALKSFPDAIGPQETTGTIGNPTQQQISAGFGLYGKGQSSVDPGPDTVANSPELLKGTSVHGPEIQEPDLEP